LNEQNKHILTNYAEKIGEHRDDKFTDIIGDFWCVDGVNIYDIIILNDDEDETEKSVEKLEQLKEIFPNLDNEKTKIIDNAIEYAGFESNLYVLLYQTALDEIEKKK